MRPEHASRTASRRRNVGWRFGGNATGRFPHCGRKRAVLTHIALTRLSGGTAPPPTRPKSYPGCGRPVVRDFATSLFSPLATDAICFIGEGMTWIDLFSGGPGGGSGKNAATWYPWSERQAHDNRRRLRNLDAVYCGADLRQRFVLVTPSFRPWRLRFQGRVDWPGSDRASCARASRAARLRCRGRRIRPARDEGLRWSRSA